MFFEDLHILIAFIIAIVGLLYLDLKIIGKTSHEIKFKEALTWTGVFILASILFAGYVWYDLGQEKAVEFVTAYTIEKILSVDNLFVFILIFSFFKVPKEYHHKVLFYGIMGAILFRAIFIFTGVKIISFTKVMVAGYEMNILIILFGIFLAITGTNSLLKEFADSEDDDTNFDKTANLVRKIFPRITTTYEGDKFFTTQNGVRYGTLLLLVVGVVEFSDLLFAVDSIPAILSVSEDPFILYTSNIFAILGLRSMYFLLANLLPMFIHLGKGVAIILAFIGFKMIASPIYHVDSLLSLNIILGILVISVLSSLISKQGENG